jgi:hypothetical protein
MTLVEGSNLRSDDGRRCLLTCCIANVTFRFSCSRPGRTVEDITKEKAIEKGFSIVMSFLGT